MTPSRNAPEVGRLLYVVPYLGDAAVARRIRMVQLGGVSAVRPVGFRRTAAAVPQIDGQETLDLGRTEDGRLARRVVSLAAAVRRTPRWGSAVGDVDVIMARSLEALVLARAFRRRFAPTAPLVYESLDIHRLVVGSGPVPTALRTLEARAMADCDLVVTSSPGFVREYFSRYHGSAPPIAILENKILSSELAGGTPDASVRGRTPPPAPPWRIGWFGMLRCRRSLHALAELCRRLPGTVRVEIHGRPAVHLTEELPAVAAATQGMTFHGPYDRRSDLADIHAGVHFCWTLDYFEAGTNSDWLLPNRLYEAGAFGRVPLASRAVETGRWLTARGAGVLLDEPVEQSLPRYFGTLTDEAFDRARAAVLRIPIDDVVAGAAQSREFVHRLAALVGATEPRAARPSTAGRR